MRHARTNTNSRVSPPRRAHNHERRSREHLAPDEVAALIDAAKGTGRHGHRDATLLLTGILGVNITPAII